MPPIARSASGPPAGRTGQAKSQGDSPVAAGALPLAARRHRLVAMIDEGLRRCGVEGEREEALVIGVSGGADSVALLLGCWAIAQRASRRKGSLQLRLVAAHVHHHLRDSADHDAEFVAQVCRRFGIELHVEHVRPADAKGNIAANARKLRYEALARVAKHAGASLVATAHHGEDQLETMLIALCRGAGLDGLSGIAWSRPMEHANTDGPITLIRPLLTACKSDCEAFCAAAKIQWREDPSNVDVTKRRARLRRDVLPVLEELWPGAARRVTAASELMIAAREALEWKLSDCFGESSQRRWERRALAALPLPIIAAGLRRAALDEAPELADELNQRHLALTAEAIRAEESAPRIFHWPRGMTVRVTNKLVTLERGPRRRGRASATSNKGGAMKDHRE